MVVNQPTFLHYCLLRYLQSCAVIKLFARAKTARTCVETSYS